MIISLERAVQSNFSSSHNQFDYGNFWKNRQVVLAASTLDYLLTPNFWCQIWPTQITKKWILMSFKAYKGDDLKAIYRIKCSNENAYHERRVITKILKLDENNQYGYAMTKPMPTGCIKDSPSWLPLHGSSSTSLKQLV